MSYTKMIVIVLMCAVFQDGIQAAHMTRTGLTYARTRINPNNLHHAGLLKSPKKIGRLATGKDSTVNPIKPVVTTPLHTNSKSASKDALRLLLVKHKENLMNMTAIIASLNIDGLDLTDLLTLKDALRSDPFTIAFATKLKIIIAKQKLPKLKSQS